MHYTVSTGNNRALKRLLALDVWDFNEKDNRGHTLLHLAVKEQNTEALKILLETKGIAKESDDNTKRTALQHAVDTKKKEIVDTLLKCGVRATNVVAAEWRKVYSPIASATEAPHTQKSYRRGRLKQMRRHLNAMRAPEAATRHSVDRTTERATIGPQTSRDTSVLVIKAACNTCSALELETEVKVYENLPKLIASSPDPALENERMLW